MSISNIWNNCPLCGQELLSFSESEYYIGCSRDSYGILLDAWKKVMWERIPLIIKSDQKGYLFRYIENGVLKSSIRTANHHNPYIYKNKLLSIEQARKLLPLL